MYAEKAEYPDKKDCHKQPDIVEKGVLALIRVIDMDDKIGEVLAGLGMARPAGSEQVLL